MTASVVGATATRLLSCRLSDAVPSITPYWRRSSVYTLNAVRGAPACLGVENWMEMRARPRGEKLPLPAPNAPPPHVRVRRVLRQSCRAALV